jgi:CubicO group peptidase (beta-lactamase class C family)
MLRFGFLLANEGRWKDSQVIPRDYVLHCGRQSPYNPHFPYSLQFDVNTDGHENGIPRDAFWKSGSGGHVLYVVPSLELVVWKLGGRDGQYATSDTGRKPSPAPPERVAERSAWKETVDAETAQRRTLSMVISSIKA